MKDNLKDIIDEEEGEEEDIISSYTVLPLIRKSSEYYKLMHLNEAKKVFWEVLNNNKYITPSLDETIKLLINYRWNLEKITNNLFSDEKTKNKMYLESGITPNEISTEQYSSCPICSEELNQDNSYSLECKHVFCVNCWPGFLSSKVSEGRGCVQSNCPALKCNVLAGFSTFEKFLTPLEFEKYQGFLVKSFTDDSKEVRWCPTANCDYFVKNPSLRSIVILCKCGNKFCFKCGLKSHDPLSCNMIKNWNLKDVDEGMNEKWILANTKPCPHCKTPTEKNEGCMHMTCSRCCKQYCWLCLQDYSTHGENTGGFYKCTIYQENKAFEAMAKEKVAQKARLELEKYKFHYERYREQIRAMKSAQDKLKPNIDFIIQILNQAMNYPINELSFLSEGVRTVIDARDVIANSYAYVYYMTNENEKLFINHLKGLLEFKAEELHRYLEKNFDEFCQPDVLDRKFFYTYKAEVNSIITVTKAYFKNFILKIKEGRDSDN